MARTAAIPQTTSVHGLTFHQSALIAESRIREAYSNGHLTCPLTDCGYWAEQPNRLVAHDTLVDHLRGAARLRFKETP